MKEMKVISRCCRQLRCLSALLGTHRCLLVVCVLSFILGLYLLLVYNNVIYPADMPSKNDHVLLSLISTIIGPAKYYDTTTLHPTSSPGNNCRLCKALRENRTRDRNITIVTAFINIGKFAKGTYDNIRGPDTYRNWISVYSQVQNAVVGYFDDPEIAAFFAQIRKGLPTNMVVVNRSDLWSFSLQKRVQYVFDDPTYPKIPPQTTNAAYVCAMHAKFDFVEATVKANPFGTEHFAWMDVGLFRELTGRDGPPFTLQLPLCHEKRAVAFSQVYEMVTDSVDTIMRLGVNWVSGAFFVANAEAMLAFVTDYRNHTELLLARRLANHDQSIFLAMYSPLRDDGARPSVPLQAVLPDSYDPWFFIPYVQRQEWLDRDKPASLRAPLKCAYKLFR